MEGLLAALEAGGSSEGAAGSGGAGQEADGSGAGQEDDMWTLMLEGTSLPSLLQNPTTSLAALLDPSADPDPGMGIDPDPGVYVDPDACSMTKPYLEQHD